MAQTGMNPKIADEVPRSGTITEYEESHYVVYLRRLAASNDESARVVLEIDPAREPSRAEKAVLNHLRRAQWMSEKGYRRLIGH